MSRKSIAIVSTMALCAAVTTASLGAGEHSGLKGSYELVKRVLPDGTELTPPDVVGFGNWTGKTRNFNVSWMSPEGERVSISLIAGYTLSEAEYCEDVRYWMTNNLGSPGVSYEVPPGKSECAPVSKVGEALTFQMPGEPPVVAFEGDHLTATAEGQFVDHWKRVD